MEKQHNFGAGPGILPDEVLTESAKAVLNFNDSGLSLLEISHRSPAFEAVLDEAVTLVKEIAKVPVGYSVLFLQGGASLQFSMVPFNLLDENKTAAYLETGVWATKAIKEAKLFGKVNIVASSKSENFSHIPKQYEIPLDAPYFHITSNNTIYGTQMQEFPKSPIPMVCDMSSDMFSRPINISDFGLIYAGAQKNMGPAGTTLIIVKDELLGKLSRAIPAMLDYKVQIEGGSMYNTPPVFPIYVSMLTLRWIKKMGGVSAIQLLNEAKADLLYSEIDRNPLFKGNVAKEDRSRMNACFVTVDPEHESLFNSHVKKYNLIGLTGHRSAGGFRASMYNALPISSVEVLVKAMQEFNPTK